jgi:hypothetical protein
VEITVRFLTFDIAGHETRGGNKKQTFGAIFVTRGGNQNKNKLFGAIFVTRGEQNDRNLALSSPNFFTF